MMNAKVFRFICALWLAFSAIGFSASAALADKPTKSEFTSGNTAVYPDVCSFPFTGVATFNVTDILYFDQSGALTREYDHVVEVDTFTANGKTLVTLPYTYNIEWLFDSSGNLTHAYSDGILLRVPLPDGSMFVSAGRVDYTAHPGAAYFLWPDRGRAGNLAGLCAALAP